MTHAIRQPQTQLSASLRFAAAAGVCAFLALAWTIAERASREAVQTATVAFSGGPVHGGSQIVQMAARPVVAIARRS